MKKAFRIIAGLSLLAVAVSCQQFKVDTQMSAEKFAANVKLSCDAQDSYTVSAANPQDIIFNVTSNVPWTITGAQEWLTVTPSSSGASSLISDVTVKAAVNTTMEDRSATLTIKSDTYKAREYQITVTQSRSGKLFVLPIYNDFTAAGGPLPFSIETNQQWEVRSDVLWLTFSKAGGEPDPEGKPMIITATAAANESGDRSATVTVVAGDMTESFTVHQKGVEFRIVKPADPGIDRLGGEKLIEVKTTLDWTVAVEGAGFTAEKVDDSHFKVAAAWNNTFAERTCTVTITGPGNVTDSMDLTQDTNFECENCEVLEDGSVKLDAAAGSRVYLKDNLRMLNMVLTMGEKHFGDKANFWVIGNVDSQFGSVALYNWLNLGTKTRIRTEGNMIATGDASYYKSTDYTITKAQLDAMNVYEYGFNTNSGDATLLDMWFNVDGTEIKKHSGPNPFTADADAYFTYYFGFYEPVSDGTWYVVKTCDLTVYED